MFELFFIYFFTLSLILILTQLGVKVNKSDIAFSEKFRWNRYYFFSFIILTLFLGTRDGVGVDFYSYKADFENIFQNIKFGESSEFGESTELGYSWLRYLLNFLNLDYHSLFLATSFITILLFFNCFKNTYQLLPIGIFMFFVGDMYNFVINGVRQGIAMMAFYSALQYINIEGNVKNKTRNLLWFTFYIIIGALFHYSILFFIPIVFILNKRILSKFNSIILIIIILLGFFINTVSNFGIFTDPLLGLIPRYKGYSEQILGQKSDAYRFGFISVFTLIVSLVTVLFYDKVKNKFPEARKFFVLYSFGTGLWYMFSQYLFIDRMILYLMYCNIFVLAYTYNYFKKQGKHTSIYLFLNISIFCFLIIKFIFALPTFIEVQIIMNDFSLWFIPLTK